MELKLTEKQFRRLLDLVYIGNWVLNSTRGDDRIRQYDEVESQVFAHCLDHGMAKLVEVYNGELIPSRAFAEGGIHEAIFAYEDITFFEILAEELALRDLDADRATVRMKKTAEYCAACRWMWERAFLFRRRGISIFPKWTRAAV